MPRSRKPAEERLTEMDMKHLNEQARAVEPPMRDGSDKCFTPIGVPVDISIFQKTIDKPSEKYPKTMKQPDQAGYTVVCTWYMGVKVFMKWERATHRLVLFVEDEDGLTKLCEWERG